MRSSSQRRSCSANSTAPAAPASHGHFCPCQGSTPWLQRCGGHAHRLDEYQRGLLVGSLALTFATAMAIAVTMGLLAGAGPESRRLFGCRIEEVVDPGVTVGGLSGR